MAKRMSAASDDREAGASKATLRERTLAVALDLFVEQGYAETSMREIAEALGVTKAALYYHFRSKDDILIALHMQLHDLVRPELMLSVTAAMTDNAEWTRIAERLISLAMQNRRLIELHLRNKDALARLHTHEGVVHHATEQAEAERAAFDLLGNQSIPAEDRIRRVATLGAIAAVLLASGLLPDIPDSVIQTTLADMVNAISHVATVPSR